MLRGLVIPCGDGFEDKPVPQKEKSGANKFESRTTRGIFSGYRLLSSGSWSGDYLVYDEEPLCSEKAWYHIHSHRFREIVLTGERMFIISATQVGLFQNTDNDGVKTAAQSKDVASDAVSEQAETPAHDVIVTYYRIDRPTAAFRVHHKVPRRRLPVSGKGVDEDPPPVPASSTGVTHYTRTNLENVGVCSGHLERSPRRPGAPLRILGWRNEMRQVVARTART